MQFNVAPKVCSTKKVRCVDAGGIAYRRSKNLLDVKSQVEAPHVLFCQEVLVHERHDDWVLTAKGWLPLEFNGKVRFLVLDTTDVDVQQAELERARAECDFAWAEATSLRRELEDSRAECADKTHKLVSLSRHLNDVSLGFKPTPALGPADPDTREDILEAALEPAAVSDKVLAGAERGGTLDLGADTGSPWTSVCENARRQIDEYVRQQALVKKHTYIAWPRVRLPVRNHFIEQSGSQWFIELRRLLAAVVELRVNMQILEIVAVRDGPEEMEAFERLPRVRCSPHHSTPGLHVDREATIPAIGTSRRIQWYSELTCVQEPFVVVDLALAPQADARNFARVMCERLAHREGHAMSRKDDGTAALSYVVPRCVARVFVWPAEPAPGEAVSEEHRIELNS